MKERLEWRALLLGLALPLWLGLAAWRGGYLEPGGPPPVQRRRVQAWRVEVLDGDTVRIGGRTLRLLAVDTPECGAPWFDGDQEPHASRAADRVRRALREAEQVELLSRGRRGVHGRELVHLLVDGRSVAEILVAEGLAYPTVALYGDGGFPELAERVLRAAQPPPFEAPWRWRRRHRVPAR